MKYTDKQSAKTAQKSSETSPKFGFFQIGVGNLFASMIIAGFILGYLTDALFDTAPVFMVAFGALGMIGGVMKAKEVLSYNERVPINEKQD